MPNIWNQWINQPKTQNPQYPQKGYQNPQNPGAWNPGNLSPIVPPITSMLPTYQPPALNPNGNMSGNQNPNNLWASLGVLPPNKPSNGSSNSINPNANNYATGGNNSLGNFGYTPPPTDPVVDRTFDMFRTTAENNQQNKNQNKDKNKPKLVNIGTDTNPIWTTEGSASHTHWLKNNPSEMKDPANSTFVNTGTYDNPVWSTESAYNQGLLNNLNVNGNPIKSWDKPGLAGDIAKMPPAFNNLWDYISKGAGNSIPNTPTALMPWIAENANTTFQNSGNSVIPEVLSGWNYNPAGQYWANTPQNAKPSQSGSYSYDGAGNLQAGSRNNFGQIWDGQKWGAAAIDPTKQALGIS